ncbi:hypothetical protein AC579_2223 [Pseudocercospora musae]|uniref:Uncharacterized protein n=1 Tax=Pseudocercospora musae TaxID=113226 RepID=A0A139GTE8_9PEZI|nr:hypothetical protein AC579_2223 [Pseudocercospora musae]KXS93462.1 hypothetical protein AC579_2223 [Pseudocercospora musae]
MPCTFKGSRTSSHNSTSHTASLTFGHTLQYAPKASTMDLAPDHFAYTDPQPESSTAAAARAKLVEDRIDSGVASIASTPTKDDLLPKQSLGREVTDGNDTQESLPEHRWDRGHIYKSSPACPYLCPWHQVCWQSQHTRPVVELLKEILEIRYAAQADEVSSDAEAQGERSTSWSRVWRRFYRAGYAGL